MPSKHAKASRAPNANKPSPYQLRHRPQLRADASWVLFQILEHGKSSREVMPKVFARHEGSDNAWLQEMVFGCLRELPKLQYWLRQLLDKPLKGEQKIVEHVIMLGFYQLAFSRTSEHAAVSETVEACAALNQHRLKGLVNANLRNFQRQELSTQDIDIPHVNLGLPKWFYKQLLKQYPEHVERIAANMNERPPLWLRVNQLVGSRLNYSSQLDAAGIEFDLPEMHNGAKAESAIKLAKRQDITSLPGFETGAFAVQDLAAQLAAEYLDVQAGEDVLDCCAAPGGKTAHILESQEGLASLDAIDSDGERLGRIDENMQRLGHTAHFGERLNLYVVDASNSEVIKTVLGDKQYDKILLDAPCSATGVIRRHPDIRWLRKSADIDATVSLQKEILKQIWQRVKPGGMMLYATCSILKQENEIQIAEFLQDNSDATLLPLHDKDNETTPGLQILPGESQMDGFYYARLLKSKT
ncbi:16S rRNA (cytosine(967)-C(5))-methyltransferase RsmB [Brumicola blandensis]|jgi:16S rRNA (cytosine967-C5)-methyltransferase|uniref:16S rRNA (cytosine(967)-C(5))-methyltransferase n=1 Tax=Brumicola blandensis TaxID=3075611 RepID=A0AAW8RAN8_9ALTE|nr:16S rRNA (cytosine(967)-C(5))-methyltransferase RsmB [Alteromonas sp. W409]MDT0584248.1 16S rRNA (cytosine(967)-C(5))-methyltransferase RsmB [Alteromonas sp. W409]